MLGDRGSSRIIMVASMIDNSGGFLCVIRHFICVVEVWGGIVMARI